MAKSKSEAGKHSLLKYKLIVLLVLLAALVVSFFFSKQIESLLGIHQELSKNQATSEAINSSNFKVNIIDVGQGSSAFIELPDGKSMLVDGGDTEYGDEVTSYLNNLGVTKIDYLVATHADSDHIGGLNYVLDHFEFKTIYRPFQISPNQDSATGKNVDELYSIYDELTGQKITVSKVTSKVYQTFITKIYAEQYDGSLSDICVFYDGLKIQGQDYEFNFFAPSIVEGYEESQKDLSVLLGDGSRTTGRVTKCFRANENNGCSAIFLLNCKNQKFLFTGDAPYTQNNASSSNLNFEEMQFVLNLTESEKNMLKNIDVYIVGHHGSSYSSSKELLEIINPRFAAISCGKDNSYGHPASDTLERISGTNRLELDYLLRTDESGSIVFGLVDGKLKYSLQVSTDNISKSLSWYILGTSIYVVIAVIVLSIQPSRKKRRA